MSEEKLDSIRARIKLLSTWLEEREYEKQNHTIAPTEDNSFLSSLVASPSQDEAKQEPIAPPNPATQDLETRAEEKTGDLNEDLNEDQSEDQSDAAQERDASGELETPSERLLQQDENAPLENIVENIDENIEENIEEDDERESDIEKDIASETDQSEAFSELDNLQSSDPQENDPHVSDAISIPPIGAVPSDNREDGADGTDGADEATKAD